jgi:hypothetical protein
MRGRAIKVLRSTALTQFPRWTPQVADEIPDRKLLTTNVKPVFRSCLFNIAHSGGDLLLVINNEDLSSHPIRAFQEKSRE